MRVWVASVLALIVTGLAGICAGKSGSAAAAIDDIADHKDFKKLLRTKNNLLVVFYEGKIEPKTSDLLNGVAKTNKGKGTLVKVNCKADGKKLCKKLKVSLVAGSSTLLKHFKDGEYHKDYDRPLTELSLNSFIQDPTGDMPWEEEPLATDVSFFGTPTSLTKGLKKDKNLGTLVM